MRLLRKASFVVCISCFILLVPIAVDIEAYIAYDGPPVVESVKSHSPMSVEELVSAKGNESDFQR